MSEPQEKPKTLEDYHQREDSSSAWETIGQDQGKRRDFLTRAADEGMALLGDEEAIRRRRLDDEFKKGTLTAETAERIENGPAETSRGSNIKAGNPPPEA